VTPAFRAFSNPATGETIQFLAPQLAGEDIVRFRWQSRPGGSIPEHVHAHQQERFSLSEGEAHFTVDGEPRVLRAGETIVIPPGVPHAESNPGPVAAVGVVELRPALRSRQFYEALGGLAAEGKLRSSGAPRNPLQLGATFWHFRREIRVTSPPVWLQNVVFLPLAAVARCCGVLPHYERWDTQMPDPGATRAPEMPARPGSGVLHRSPDAGNGS
jgi:quercetin dioxygenase-like cupin family protein